MALLLFTTPLSSSSSPHVRSATTQPSVFRLCNKSLTLQLKTYVGSRIKAPIVPNTRCIVIVKAIDVDGAGSTSSEPPTPPPSDSKVESVSIENLPLESKLHLNLEQKMKMKLAKKIRLRRKRLVRKRHLRKKGRWPPSKMKKYKNV